VAVLVTVGVGVETTRQASPGSSLHRVLPMPPPAGLKHCGCDMVAVQHPPLPEQTPQRVSVAPAQGASVGDGVGQSVAPPPKTLHRTGSVGTAVGEADAMGAMEAVGAGAPPSPPEPHPATATTSSIASVAPPRRVARDTRNPSAVASAVGRSAGSDRVADSAWETACARAEHGACQRPCVSP
jgi:hypothetical protein